MSDPFRINRPGRLRQAWWRHRDSQVVLGIAMAAVAVFFIVGIVAAFNNARLDSMARNPPPAATANAPASSTAPPVETTGSNSFNQPASPAPQNAPP
jgi:hypothetical protein